MLGLLSKPQAAAHLFQTEVHSGATVPIEGDTTAAAAQPMDVDTVTDAKPNVHSAPCECGVAAHKPESEGQGGDVDHLGGIAGAHQSEEAEAVTPRYQTVATVSPVGLDQKPTWLPPPPSQSVMETADAVTDVLHDSDKEGVIPVQQLTTDVHSAMAYGQSKPKDQPSGKADMPAATGCLPSILVDVPIVPAAVPIPLGAGPSSVGIVPSTAPVEQGRVAGQHASATEPAVTATSHSTLFNATQQAPVMQAGPAQAPAGRQPGPVPPADLPSQKVAVDGKALAVIDRSRGVQKQQRRAAKLTGSAALALAVMEAGSELQPLLHSTIMPPPASAHVPQPAVAWCMHRLVAIMLASVCPGLQGQRLCLH